jgi:hypothetical protein
MKLIALFVSCVIITASTAWSQETDQWKYLPVLLRPFWDGDTTVGESVLFIKDPRADTA